MTFSMQNIEPFTFAEMKDFIEGNQHLRLQVEGPQQAVYQLMERTLKAQQYCKPGKGERGVVRGFLAKVTDLGRPQVTRLISRWMKTRRIEPRPRRRGRFPIRYTREDIVLLARRGALWARASRMRLTGTCPDLRCGASASGSTRCSATRSSSAWPAFGSRTSTICVTRPVT